MSSSALSESSVLSEYLNKRVSVVTTDGRLYVGYLEGYDHSTNIVLRNALIRDVTSPDTPDEAVGLFVIRGDCVSVIGLMDPKLDARIDWDRLKGDPLKRFR